MLLFIKKLGMLREMRGSWSPLFASVEIVLLISGVRRAATTDILASVILISEGNMNSLVQSLLSNVNALFAIKWNLTTNYSLYIYSTGHTYVSGACRSASSWLESCITKGTSATCVAASITNELRRAKGVIYTTQATKILARVLQLYSEFLLQL